MTRPPFLNRRASPELVLGFLLCISALVGAMVFVGTSGTHAKMGPPRPPVHSCYCHPYCGCGHCSCGSLLAKSEPPKPPVPACCCKGDCGSECDCAAGCCCQDGEAPL